MTNNTQRKVEQIAQKGEALITNASEKVDNLLVKTATLRHQVSQLKDELVEEIAVREQRRKGDRH